jgi:hypothetical protein
MSIKRLTREEKAVYLIGLAVTRQFEQAPRDPETRKEITAVCNWIEHWLTPDERQAITETTGWVIEADIRDELFGP